MLAILRGVLVEGQRRQLLGYLRLVLLDEDAGVVAEGVLAVIVAVLGHLVDEEQREHLDPLGEQLALLVDVGADHLPDLDAPLRVVGHVRGHLPGGDEVAVAQLHDVANRIDVGDDQIAVGLEPTRDVVQPRSCVQPLGLALDASCGLHFHLDPCPGFGALGDLDRVQVEVSGASGQAFDRDAPHGDLLDQLLVVGVKGVEAVDLVVLDLVGRRVAQHHQRVEPRQCLQRLGGADLLRLVDDDDRAVGADHVDRAARLEVVEFLVDAPVVLPGGVERLDVDDHHLHPGARTEALQLVQLR